MNKIFGQYTIEVPNFTFCFNVHFLYKIRKFE